MKIIAKNKKAYYDYEIIDDIETGIVLAGEEVKSLRNGTCSIKEAYAKIDNAKMEIYIYNMTIDHYKYSTHLDIDTKRKRKLLLHKNEIKRISKKVDEKGFTLIPLSVYFNNRNIAKIKLGICRGKRKYDKRELIKRRDFEREQARNHKSKY